MTYRIEVEHYQYTYRSYMASEDQREDDCVGSGVRWAVYRGNRRLKTLHNADAAKEHIRKLKKTKGGK